MASPAKTANLAIRSRRRADAIDITQRVEALVRESGVADGLCHVYVPHTTAGVFVNENADPDVLQDLLKTLDSLVPWDKNYSHAEGNAAAHIKATLVGTSQSIPVHNGRLELGRWQGIFFAEFDGPRERELTVTIVPA
jgi:secondary thiamine-phosphate synthase enzyme